MKIYSDMQRNELDMEVIRMSRKPTELLSLGYAVLCNQLAVIQDDPEHRRTSVTEKKELMLRYGLVVKAITEKLFSSRDEEGSNLIQ